MKEIIKQENTAVSIYNNHCLQGAIEPKFKSAIDFLSTCRVPADFIDIHPGPGGSTLFYINHAKLTDLLNKLFGLAWSFNVKSYMVHEDNSVSALCEFTLDIPMRDGTSKRISLTEVGASKPSTAKNISIAERVAAATSRALPRCIMRLFGFGLELYNQELLQEDTMSINDKQNIFRKFCNQYNVDYEIVKEKAKEKGVTAEMINKNFPKALRLFKKAIDEILMNKKTSVQEIVKENLPPAETKEEVEQFIPLIQGVVEDVDDAWELLESMEEDENDGEQEH